MPTFRMLHAAGWDADAVVIDPPPKLADVFKSARFESLSVLIDRAIEIEVDALVLMPAVHTDGFSRGPSHLAETHLRECFSRLNEVGISGIIAVSANAETWKRLAGGASKLTILTPGDDLSLPARDNEPTVRFRCIDRLLANERQVASSDAIEILLAPSLSTAVLEDGKNTGGHYLAFGAGERATVTLRAGVAHSPGPMQSSGQALGPRGATLVTVEPTGQTRTEALPCAVLRFESLKVETEVKDGLEDLALRMTERLEELRAEPCELAWHIRWTVEAAEPLFSTLNDPLGRADLISLLPENAGDLLYAHEVQVVPHPIWPALDDAFAAEFEAALQEQSNLVRKQQPQLLALPDSTPHRKRLARLVGGCDFSAVLGDARRFGLRVVLAAKQDEESA